MPRRLIALAAAALALTALPPPAPAEAQTVARICVANQAALIIRSRLTYTDWQGVQHTTAWTVLALGQRQCNTLQDISSLSIQVQFNDMTWKSGCTRNFTGGDAARTRTLFVAGTPFASGHPFSGECVVEQ